MMDKVMETFAKMLFRFTEPESSEAERSVDEEPIIREFLIKGEKMKDEEPMSNCCIAPFTYPGWPDSDFCSQCHEHAGIYKDE